jgi:hypothetical protein
MNFYKMHFNKSAIKISHQFHCNLVGFLHIWLVIGNYRPRADTILVFCRPLTSSLMRQRSSNNESTITSAASQYEVCNINRQVTIQKYPVYFYEMWRGKCALSIVRFGPLLFTRRPQSITYSYNLHKLQETTVHPISMLCMAAQSKSHSSWFDPSVVYVLPNCGRYFHSEV